MWGSSAFSLPKLIHVILLPFPGQKEKKQGKFLLPPFLPCCAHKRRAQQAAALAALLSQITRLIVPFGLYPRIAG
jgi:hypothetical protein